MNEEHLLDGTLSRASSFLGLAILFAEPVSGHTRPRLAVVGASLLVLGTAWHLLLGTAVIAGELSASAIADVVAETVFGRAAARTLAAASALVVLRLLLPPLGRAARAAIGAGAIGVAGALALEGHAAPAGASSPQTVVQAIHIASTMAWLGGLVALADAVACGSATTASVLRFGRIAVVLMPIAVATGLIRMTAHLASDGDLASDYGRVLVAKLLLVAGVLAFAVRHRVRSIPSLRASASAPTFDRDLGVELVLAFATLLAAASLAQLAPPA